ncbi:hypothetical protein F2Q70_00012706 [Brassica cretica]|uniref:RNase H type-1 domain-containing protein n=1 Tax=Brassica cretica TaxID=69181 RepID=A0A8S9M0V9_BRACR|nr:hypothetical protein F2Q70_00012706 [Brassica cretica]
MKNMKNIEREKVDLKILIFKSGCLILKSICLILLHVNTCGASWLFRDSRGNVLLHSRRAFSDVSSSVHAFLLALSWLVAAMSDLKMKKVIFEFPSITAGFALEHPLTHPTSYYSCHQVLRIINSIPGSSLHLIPITCNSPAIQIATSVIRDHRYRSYVARLGPNWLAASLSKEAS